MLIKWFKGGKWGDAKTILLQRAGWISKVYDSYWEVVYIQTKYLK